MKLFRVTCCCGMLILSLVVFALPPGSQASAASGLVTQGDVEAILHAGYPSTGCAPLFQVHPVRGFEDCTRATLIPFSDVSGRHYCVNDWHIVRLIWGTAIDNVYIFTKKQAIDELNGTTTALTLDGVTLPVTRTPVTMLNTADQKRLGFPGPTFAFMTGSILSPTALSVGDHTVGFVGNDPVFGSDQDSSTFTVDPSGTGSCLQPLP
jgi:hypothetical protein